MNKQQRISLKHNLIVANPSNQTMGQLEVKNIVMTKDLPMNDIYTPPAVFKASAEMWTGGPIVAPIHVETETAANTFGTITRAFVESGKLKADAVFNLDKLSASYPILFNRLIKGEPISGSIHVDVLGFEVGNNYSHGGRSFNFLTTEITKVFHYALLQDIPAACKPIDGCGVNLSASKNNKEVSMTEEQFKALAKELKDSIAEEVKTLSAKQGETTRPDKDDTVTGCQLKALAERVTANEATTAELKASLAKVNELNEGLKAEVVTLKAEATQAKNNSTGVGVVSDDQQLEPEHNF